MTQHQLTEEPMPWAEEARILHVSTLDRLKDLVCGGDDEAAEEILRRAYLGGIDQEALSVVFTNCPDLQSEVNRIRRISRLQG